MSCVLDKILGLTFFLQLTKNALKSPHAVSHKIKQN